MPQSEIKIHLVSKASREPVRGDVIFIHGLDGHARLTWTNKNKEFWPSWLAKDEPSVDVWTLAYPASAIMGFWRRGMGLNELATAILHHFIVTGIGTRPIVFVGHSNGGLIIKKLLKLADTMNKESWQLLRTNVRGVLFFGTPHSGSSVANIAREIIPFFTSALVDDLKINGSNLLELNVWYRQNAGRLGILTHAYRESEPVGGAVTVVDASSADPEVLDCIPISLHGNHSDICKPASPDSTAYKGSLYFIRECFPNELETLNSQELPLVLEPLAGSAQVFMGESKYEVGAGFSFGAEFFVHAGDSDIRILGFQGLYAAYGCYALNTTPSLSVSGVEVKSGPEGYHLQEPVHVDSKKSIRLRYSRRVFPSKMTDVPASCDLGDLELRVLYRAGELTAEASWYFEFQSGGGLKSIQGFREVPRFTDAHLLSLRDTGRITHQEYEALLSFRPQVRYMIASAPGPSSGFDEVPEKLRDILKRICCEG